MSLRDWSSDVCSSDLDVHAVLVLAADMGDESVPEADQEIGRASGRERVCNDVWISVVAVSLKKKKSVAGQPCDLAIYLKPAQPLLSACLESHGVVLIFFFKQKTAYEMSLRDWSSDVCSSDLRLGMGRDRELEEAPRLVEGAL